MCIFVPECVNTNKQNIILSSKQTKTMKKLLFTLLLAAAVLPGWADETQLTIIGGATSAGWATGTGTEETRVLERTVGRMVRTAENTWVWVGTLTAGTDDAGRFKITNGAGANDWGGYWAPSENKEVGNNDTEEFNLVTSYPGDWKFQVTATGMYRITVDLSKSTKKMTVDKLSAPTQDANDYYQIGTADQFMWFAGKVTSEESSSLKAKLTADISFSEKNFFPLACEKHQFEGELDGAGHTIDYAVIDDPRDIVGIFRYLAPGANVHDLVIGSNCSFTGSNNVGGIAGVANGTGTVTLSKVINAATIHANNKANGTNAAGFVAFADGATVNVTNCANLGQTSTNGESASSAAFIGWIATSASFTNCWNGGTINDMDGTNNLYRTGDTQTITVDNCYDVSGGNCGQGSQLATTAKGSGELCYKLNGDQSDIKWYQTLHGTDSYPYLLDTHKQVYQVSETSYSNIPASDGKVQISNAEDLMTFSAEVNAGNEALSAELTEDIDMAGVTYTPIGTDAYKYEGTFDGKGCHIKNLIITGDNQKPGLFHVCGNATIRNLIMDSTCKITSNNTSGGNGGAAFVAIANTDNSVAGTLTIENCGNEAMVNGSAPNKAAFVGFNYNNNGNMQIIISNCYNRGNISGGYDNCAFMGWNAGSSYTITNCYNTGTISDTHSDGNTWGRSSGSRTVVNSYTTQSCSSIDGLASSYSSDKVSSGELCYLLKGTQETNAFTQAIGTDAYPTFGSATVDRGQWFGDDYIYYNIDESSNITVNELNLDDTKTVYNVPAKVTAKSVTLTRTLHQLTSDGTQPRWNTFCSPVDIAKSNFSAAKELTGVTANGNNYSMAFTEVAGDVLEAGKPYMVQVSEGKSSLTASNVAVATAVTPVTINGLTFTGNFTNGKAPLGSFIISNNVFYNVDSDVTLKAFRGYIEVASGDNVKALDFTFDDDATSLNEELRMKNEELEGSIYNLAGQMVNGKSVNGKLPKGIYIVNGKKILFK